VRELGILYQCFVVLVDNFMLMQVIGELPTKIIVLRYVDRIFVTITQLPTFGTLVCESVAINYRLPRLITFFADFLSRGHFLRRLRTLQY
jgi:hypothetical protein